MPTCQIFEKINHMGDKHEEGFGARQCALRIPERTVPFPDSISAEARSAMERFLGSDGLPTSAHQALPLPTDHVAWERMQAAVDAQYAAGMQRMSGILRSNATTLRLGETTLHIADPSSDFDERHAVIDLHGGALVFGGGDACLVGTRKQADQLAVRCYGVD